mmetsp:Transcript_356/g.996  ORF Transcript_356/g.996 Transcript_356/m.996 type:complete len:101 (-) Transcript_356:589-891(-)
MVAEDKFFAAQHSKVFKKRMPYWTMKMFFMQLLGLALFMLGSGYSPFCPHKYDHGKSAAQPRNNVLPRPRTALSLPLQRLRLRWLSSIYCATGIMLEYCG